MDIDDLRALLNVLEHGSIQSAARATRTPRTTLRRQLDHLEAEVGVPLLVRGTAGVELTEAGRAMAERGRTLVEEASALLAAVRSRDTEPSGLLRVLLPSGLPPHVTALLYGLSRERFPRLGFACTTSDDPVAELRDEVDLVVFFGDPPTSGAWITSRLRHAPERLLASPDYLERAGTPTRVEELAQHALLGWRPPGEDGSRWPLLAGGSFAVSPRMVAADVHLVRTLAMFGHGIALTPDGGVPADPTVPGELVPVLPELVGRSNALRAMVPEATAALPRGRSLLAMVKDLMGMLEG